MIILSLYLFVSNFKLCKPFHYWSGQKRPAGNVTLFLERPKAAKQTETIFETLCSPGQAIVAYLLFLLFEVSVDQ